MRKVMAEAEVGDDVFGEDPTVNRLQEVVAALLGKEAALFVPSGTMANQIALKCHTEPGDEVICERSSHFLHYEVGAPAFLSGIQACTLNGTAGVIYAEQIEEAIRPPAYYFPRTRLIALENTHNAAGGTIFPLEEMPRIRRVAEAHNLRMHMDGARLWNACIATGISPGEYAVPFDSVSVCFSKGLGAPVGSAIVGSHELIEKGRRFRKMFGGGMRQAGILAAAALYALENNRDRLREDHHRSRWLAHSLGAIAGLKIDHERVQTNIVVIDISGTKLGSQAALNALRQEGVLLVPLGPKSLRAVTHLDVSDDDLRRAITAFECVFA